VRVTKVADASGQPAPAPTTTSQAPFESMQKTAGGTQAEVSETMGGE
jgi:hypothetical protein